MKTSREYFNYLLKNYPNLEKSDAYSILETVLEKSYAELVLNFDYVLKPEEKDKMKKAMDKLDEGYPLPYITKRKFFYKNDFYVNEDVLIPRNDTQVIVDEAVKFINDEYENNTAVVYDVCSGSGAIGLSIKYERTDTDVYLSDISKEAMEVARENEVLLDLKDVHLLVGNFLKPFKKLPKANIIVCNPPYIDPNDPDVEDSVKKYEPHIALFAKDNGLYFYEQMAKSYHRYVDDKKKWVLLMEIGYKQKDAIEAIFQKTLKKNNKINFVKDLKGNYRVLKITN